MDDSSQLNLSGERFAAVYHMPGSVAQVEALARDICVEQTVEFPEDLISRKDIHEQIIGRVVSVEPLEGSSPSGASVCEVAIEFPVEVAGCELTQLLNVLYGNVSLKPSLRLVRFDMPASLSSLYKGPRFGCRGLRDHLGTGARDRPLLSTAIKPMGMSPKELSEYAYKFALGGIDLIKDDHGLADQSFVRLEERVKCLSDAVRRANEETGRKCLYLPNVTAPADQLLERARFARRAGAGGYLIAPGLTGWDGMRQIADDEQCGLPIMSHPAFLGAFTTSQDGGISHGALYGQINRLAGADVTIFPNYGGRFSFSQDECRDIVDGCTRPMGALKTIFPAPAGGMKVERVPELRKFYGSESVLLIGGDLHRNGSDLVENCRQFAKASRR